MQDHSRTLAEFFGTLGSHGDKAAIIQAHEEGARLLSYETLATDVSRHAQALIEKGLERGDYVILFANGGPDWITAFLAAIAAGAVPIPLDTQTDEDTLRHILEDSGTHWAVIDAPRAEVLEAAGFAGNSLRLDDSTDDTTQIAQSIVEK
ncbi:MAG: AMP-binding protein, partial [Gammaproteobacteria bacterium]